MSHRDALEYFHVLLAAYEALHNGTSPAEVQGIADELRALNPGQPMVTALETKLRQMRTVREMLVPASDEGHNRPPTPFGSAQNDATA